MITGGVTSLRQMGRGPETTSAASRYATHQLNPIRVDDAEHRRGGQEDLSPCVMGPEEAKEAGGLRGAGEQRAKIAGEPPTKRAAGPTLSGREPPPRGHPPSPGVGVGAGGEGC